MSRFVFAGMLAPFALLQGGDHLGRGREREPDAERVVEIVFEGLVFQPDGAPAEGALMVCSAGGRGIADRNGRYRLEARMPIDAEHVRIEVTSSSDGYAGATIDVPRPAHAGTLRLDPLWLQPLSLCPPAWLPTLGEQPGVSVALGANDTFALLPFDDGTGAVLVVGGRFSFAGGAPANNVARWDGARWSGMGGGLNGQVFALALLDDGGGPKLYAGGDFSTSVAGRYLARWTGSNWQYLAGPQLDGPVRALCVFDDGTGPALYAGGDFTRAVGTTLNGVAKRVGSSWAPLASGVTGGGLPTVAGLTVYDDGGGPALYAGGDFAQASGVTANGIARWDGTSWTSLGSGMGGGGFGPLVSALTTYDEGTGPALYAGGSFTTVGGASTSFLAKWDGSAWTTLGAGLSGSTVNDVRSLTAFDDGSGAALYVGGSFLLPDGTPTRVARWDGTSWTGLFTGGLGVCRALAIYDDGTGPALHVAGVLNTATYSIEIDVGKWNGTRWVALGRGLNGAVRAVTRFDDGNGPALYAGGEFTAANGKPANRLAKWDGRTWSALDARLGSSQFDATVYALSVFDDGAGAALYAAGIFRDASSTTVNHIAKLAGSSWVALDGGVSSSGGVLALAEFDDGGGPALYAGGSFTTAGGAAANNIARWDGAQWSPLGGGLLGGSVAALAVFDDGNGPALYAAGTFTSAGGASASHVAKWDGASWAQLGSGTSDRVNALAVFDDGNGPALYAAGSFFAAGGVDAHLVARWDGTSWSALGPWPSGSYTELHALTVFDDGGGAALYAGGLFTTAGGSVAANHVAKWDGASWAPLGSGTSAEVYALAAFDSPDTLRPALFAGGAFASAFDSSDSYLARWSCLSPDVRRDKRHR